MKSLIVGLGIQGRKRRAVAGTNVIGVVDPVHPEAQYRDIREVDLGSFDAAYVCTPDEPKYEILSYLLKHKKHALVEKPILAERTEQIKELKELAESNGVACYTAYNHRFEPHFIGVRDLIQKGSLGELYLLRLFYGNGTARDVRNSTWRDRGAGVLPDIGSHLLDTMLFFFNDNTPTFRMIEAHCKENRSLDHFVISGDRGSLSVSLEATLLSWKNTFRLDLIGSEGSAHIDCLCKWGPSSLSIRTRELPSGKPDEQVATLTCKDPTWEIENQFFLEMCKRGENNLANDLWINEQLQSLSRNLYPPT